VTNQVNQAVIFDYELTLQPNTDVFLAIDYVASQLHTTLSELYLTCRTEIDDNGDGTLSEASESLDNTTASSSDNNNGTSNSTTTTSFAITALSSLPMDFVADDTIACAATSNTTDCTYRVDAAFLAKVWYFDERRRRRRKLQDESVQVDVTDPALLETFGDALETFFTNGTWTSGMSSIVGINFLGLTNNGNEESSNDDGAAAVDDGAITDDAGGGEFTNDDVAPAVDDAVAPPSAASQSDRSVNKGAIAGSIVGAVLGVSLIVALVLLCCCCLRRRRRRQGQPNEKVADADAAAAAAAKSVQQPPPRQQQQQQRRRRYWRHAKTLDTTAKDTSYFTDLDADPSYERDDRAMLGDASYIASDDGSFYAQQQLHVAVVVGDDQSFGDTSGYPMLDPNAFRKSASVQRPNPANEPSFVRTDEILDSLRQAELWSRMKSESKGTAPSSSSSPRLVGSPSRGQRDYGVPDTVQL
jgi:hypothetical protein